MKKLFFIVISILCLQVAVSQTVSQKIDTIYYDTNWKGVPIKSFAAYKTIVYMSNGSQYENMEKSFYITGELQGEFTPVYIDKFDGNKSKFKGKFITYYKSGKKEFEGFYNDSSKLQGIHTGYYESGQTKFSQTFKNGLRNGELNKFYENGKLSELSIFSNGIIQNGTLYYENGNIKAKSTYLNGKFNGTLFQYSEDGSRCIEIEMFDGQPKNNFITLVDKNGNRTKYDNEMKNIIQDNPTSIDRKKTVSNGAQFLYYQMNGIFLAVNLSSDNEVGKYYVASIVLGNNCNQSILFETDRLRCIVSKADKTYDCKVYTSDEYSAIVGKKLRSRSFWNSLGENLSTLNAGVSTSSASSSSTGYVNSAAIEADNNGNVAVGVGSSYGANSTYSQTQSYNGAAQYQANQTAKQNISQYDNQLQQYQQSVDAGYLKSNVVEPGKSVTGNVNIKFQKGDKITLYIPINGSVYSFVWDN